MLIEPKVKTKAINWIQKLANGFPDTKTAIQIAPDAVNLIHSRIKEKEKEEIKEIMDKDASKVVIESLVSGKINPEHLSIRDNKEVEEVKER